MENNAAFRDPAALAACSQPADSSSPCGFTAPPSGDLAARSKHHLSRFVESQPPANYAVFLAQVQVSRHAAGADLAFELQAGQFAGRNVGGAVNVSSAATQAQALRTPIMQDILHYEKHHRQGLGASLREWNRLQGSHHDVLVPVLFTDEAGCKAHIVEWQKHQE